MITMVFKLRRQRRGVVENILRSDKARGVEFSLQELTIHTFALTAVGEPKAFRKPLGMLQAFLVKAMCFTGGALIEKATVTFGRYFSGAEVAGLVPSAQRAAFCQKLATSPEVQVPLGHAVLTVRQMPQEPGGYTLELCVGQADFMELLRPEGTFKGLLRLAELPYQPPIVVVPRKLKKFQKVPKPERQAPVKRKAVVPKVKEPRPPKLTITQRRRLKVVVYSTPVKYSISFRLAPQLFLSVIGTQDAGTRMTWIQADVTFHHRLDALVPKEVATNVYYTSHLNVEGLQASVVMGEQLAQCILLNGQWEITMQLTPAVLGDPSGLYGLFEDAQNPWRKKYATKAARRAATA